MKERINITVDLDLLERIDEVVQVEHTTRSALFRRVMREYVEVDSGPVERKPGPPPVDVLRAAETRTPYVLPGAPGGTLHTLSELTPLLRAFFAARDDVAVAWVFGSVARGHTWGGSDVDVAVLPRDGSLGTRDRRLLGDELSHRLEQVLGSSIDLVVLDQESTLLRYRIVSEGAVVYGEGTVSAETRMRAISEYLDFKPVIAEADQHWAERVDRYDSV